MTKAVETKFNFKARTIKDENDKEIGKTKKQPALTVNIPQPTEEEIVAYLQSTDEAHKKVKEVIVDAVYAITRDYAKSLLDEVIETFGTDDSKTITPADLDYDKLSLEYIANLPPSQRGARAIPPEDFEAFYQDYMRVMVAATGKPEDKIKNHIGHFQKPTRIKNAKDILAVLVEQLDVYLATSPNLEDTGEVAQRIRGKFDKWAKEDEKFDVSAL